LNALSGLYDEAKDQPSFQNLHLQVQEEALLSQIRERER